MHLLNICCPKFPSSVVMSNVFHSIKPLEGERPEHGSQFSERYAYQAHSSLYFS